MAGERQIYGEIDNVTDLKHVFGEIRDDVEKARTRPALTELYKRAGYLITLTHAHAWKEKFGGDVRQLREVGRDEFARTARKINRQAKEIGTEADYDETWGE